jgi:hypothetical protein
MNLMRYLAVMTLALSMSSVVFADSGSIVFTNSDGKIDSNAAQTTLSLVNSTLFAVQGLNSSYDCAGSCNAGSVVDFTTGTVIGSQGPKGNSIATTLFPLSAPAGSQVTTFGSTGADAFTVTEKPGNGLLGFTFTGGFSSESWSCLTGATCVANVKNGKIVSYTGTWAFQGNLVDAVLDIDGQKFNIPMAGTVDLTTSGGTVTYNGAGKPVTFTDSQGTTNFMSPVPEPSSFALFGSGLIALGLLTRRKFVGRPASSDLR